MDFQQGLITTIHDYTLALQDPQLLRQGLRERPTTILIPCLMEEFRRPALSLIRSVLKDLEGLHQLVIALAAESVDDVFEAEAFFAEMPFPVHVQWTNAPAVQELLRSFSDQGLDLAGPPGKGWAVWQGLGVATRSAEAIALFDADIRTFTPAYPQRMLLPLLLPSSGVAYVKAFYSRLSLETHALQGRGTRLFVGPLLTALSQLLDGSPFLNYLQAFRYPLAGEFAFTRDLAVNLRIPCDWGLEIGLLSEVHRHVALSRIAQVDLGLFDHKHKTLGSTPREGLQRMCSEILASVLRGLMEHQGTTIAAEQDATLEVLFRRVGEDRIRQFALDSAVNNLPYNRHGEELAVQDFSNLIRPGVQSFLNDPLAIQLPSWSRLLSCAPRLQDDLAAAGLDRSGNAGVMAKGHPLVQAA